MVPLKEINLKRVEQCHALCCISLLQGYSWCCFWHARGKDLPRLGRAQTLGKSGLFEVRSGKPPSSNRTKHFALSFSTLFSSLPTTSFPLAESQDRPGVESGRREDAECHFQI